MTRHQAQAALAMAIAAAVFPAVGDVLNEKAVFHIPSQSMPDALIEFSKQADVQVMSSVDAYRRLRSTDLDGIMSTDAALRLMLRDTGLQFKAYRRAVVVKSMIEGKTSMLQLKPVATEPSLEEAEGESARTVTVTGTHIRDSVPIGSQVTVLDRERINRTGFSTVQDVIRSLPQNFGGGPSEDTNLGNEGNTGRSSTFNLRGLGAGSTLILLNGHRMAPTGTSASFVDVSGIPQPAVERIEVLPDGASAVYGADAVGGVVNIILRDDFNGAESRGGFGGVTEGSMREQTASQLFGRHWATGHVTAVYEYRHRDALPAAERNLTHDSDLRIFGGDNFSVPMAYPGTLTIDGKTYAIPQRFEGTTPPVSALVAGTRNLHNLNDARDIVGDQTTHSGLLAASQDLGSLTLSVDVLQSRRISSVRSGGSLATFMVPVGNPFRVSPQNTSASTPYRVDYNFGDELGVRIPEATIDSLNIHGTAKTAVSRNWSVAVSYSISAEDLRQTQKNAVNFNALNSFLADRDPNTAFNPFGVNNQSTLDSIRASTSYRSFSRVDNVNLVADGSVSTLRSGNIRLAAGADFRSQTFDPVGHDANGTPLPAKENKRQVSAGFVELQVPLTHSLQTSIAARYDRYNDFGDTLSPRFAAEWAVTPALSLHGSWGRSFKSPNMPDLNEPNYSYVSRATNSTGGQSSILTWGGGNSELRPERAVTWTTGIQWVAPSIVVDLSYWNVDYRNREFRTPFSQALLIDSRFASMVTLNPAPSQREPACNSSFLANSLAAADDCMTTPVAALVDLRWRNISRTLARGFDISGTSGLQSKWGYWSLDGSLSYTTKFSEAATPTAKSRNLLDTVSNPLRFKLRTSASWSRGSLHAAFAINHTGAYVDDVSLPQREVDDWTSADAQFSYDVDPRTKGWLRGCKLSLSIQNVFNTDPPFVNNPSGVGYDRENFDIIKRFISLRAEKSW